MNPALVALRDSWSARWPEALALWSRFTMLREPRWCFDEEEAARESLTTSFAMIRLTDHAVVINLADVLENHLEEFPLEVMGHEIGHHVFCPADLSDQARLIARIRRGLPGKENQAAFIGNLYTDLLINDRLQRQSSLRMNEVYSRLGGGSADRMWTFYTRIYEILWNLPKGSLSKGAIDAALDSDAGLGARLLRVYARDWLKGAGRFAALSFPYLAENGGEGLKKALRGWLDSQPTKGQSLPDGLAEMDDDEFEEELHPSFDPAITGEEAEARPDSVGDEEPRVRYREPFEYRDLMKSVGVDLPDDELTIRYYRERALPHLIRFPVKEGRESAEPLPEGLDTWDASESLENLDVFESLMVSDKLVPGFTTVQRTYGSTDGALPEPQPVDLYLGVDCSGSMQNPALQMSYPVLAGTIIALSALRAGARVMVVLSGEPGSYKTTDGFLRDEREILRVLTGYLGTGYTFGVRRLEDAFKVAPPRPAHIMIVTDHDIFAMLGEDKGGETGWDVAKKSLDIAGGGGTYVLHMAPHNAREEVRRMCDQGFDVVFVQSWDDIVPFAREFSRRTYEKRGALSSR